MVKASGYSAIGDIHPWIYGCMSYNKLKYKARAFRVVYLVILAAFLVVLMSDVF